MMFKEYLFVEVRSKKNISSLNLRGFMWWVDGNTTVQQVCAPCREVFELFHNKALLKCQ
jgi:hypothetical protein